MKQTKSGERKTHSASRWQEKLWCLTIALSLAAGMSRAVTVLDQAFVPSPATLTVGIDGNTHHAQTFTVGTAGIMAQVDVFIARAALPGLRDLVFELRGTVGGVPTGTNVPALATVTLPAASIPTTTSWVPIPLCSFGVSVVPGDVLAIVLALPGGPNTDYTWFGRADDAYATGAAFFRNYGLSITNWTPSGAGYDLGFRSYVSISPPCDPAQTNTVAQKWLQVPDTSFNGIDVRVTDYNILADDFRCNATGPITQVRIWGSWLYDRLPPQPPCFGLSLWTDVPRTNNCYSYPGYLLCTNYFYPGQYTFYPYTNGVDEHFFDPVTGVILGYDTIIWEYVFDIPANTCWQTNGNIYWVSLSASCFDTNAFFFGWKTCPTNWNDDAVFRPDPNAVTFCTPLNGPYGPWVDLRRPPYNTNSLDLAFEILTGTTPTNIPPTNTVAQKWLQVPDTSFNGLDVRATDPKQLADDFLCTATGPITQIRIWGSWLWDALPPTQPYFSVGIWTDVPVGPTNLYSQPGTLLCGNFFAPGQYTYAPYLTGVDEQFFDPNIPGIIGFDWTIWEYVFDLTNNPCWQTKGNIYWLSINAVGFDTNQFLFGWKTCPTNWNDDAVFRDVNGGPVLDWRELRRPPLNSNSLDLAFEIITTGTTPTNPPTTNVVDKWLQIPDTSPNGLDVKVTDPKQLADDFRCNATGPITQVRIWGSWLWDALPPTQPYFSVGIWTDVPVGPTNLYSQPGTLVCGNFFAPGEYTYSPYTNGVEEQFFDPNIPGIIGFDWTIWEYVFTLPANSCWQTNGNIYWLSINAAGFDTNFVFGWKTCPTNWNDDAVFRDLSGPVLDWRELRRPPLYTNSLNLAFEIITTSTNQVPPTNTVAQKWLQIPDTSTNGLDVKATDPKILADDFLCTATGPITQVRIWTSWRYDRLPPQPPCFSLGIWSDIPTNANILYSRPGAQLCNWQFPPGTYTNLVYTNNVFEQFFDPNVPGIIGSDTVIWEYVFDWPTNLPCWQTNGNVYWLSVQADCFDTNQFLFGWKTCPTNWNDDAVFGDSQGFGAPPTFWQELRRPPYYTNSLDLAFEIITGKTNQCPPPTISCSDLNVECGTTWVPVPPPAWDNCCNTPLIPTLQNARTNGFCPWVISLAWLATDCAGQTATCTQTVWVVDTQAPIITCSNLTVECGTNWTFGQATAWDVCCGTNATVWLASSNVTYIDPPCRVLWTAVWEARDCCSNVSTCTQTVTIVDTTPPVITCGTNKTVECGCFLGSGLPVESVLRRFTDTGGSTPGANPTGGLMLASDGMLYGTTWGGGTYGLGTVFKVNRDGTGYVVVHHFSGTGEGKNPHSRLVQASDGMLYGTTALGGSGTYGTVFKLDPSTLALTTLHNFTTAGSDGFYAYTGLLLGQDGWLYGVTYRGGTNVEGTVYKLDPRLSPPYDYTLLHHFPASSTDGHNPYSEAGLVQGNNGMLYGTTYSGGSNDMGTVFTLDTRGGSYTVLHRFPGTSGDGSHPIGGMLLASDGNLYGVTYDGGSNGVGTVFTLNTAGGDYSVLHHFSTAAGEGQNPVPNLIEGCDKALYGTTIHGGAGGSGTVFKLNKDRSGYAVVYSFPGTASDGWEPYGSLLMGSDNAIYGMTRYGGTNNLGTIYKLSWPLPFDPPAVWDACCDTNVTLSYFDATNGFCPWVITRTWTATDCCTNSTNCSQTVTVVDTTPPTIVCPTNITVITCATNVQLYWSLTATDACCLVSVTSSPPSGSWFTNFTTNTVVCTATDCCSNSITCSFQVTVLPPPLDVSITNSAGTIIIRWSSGVLVYKNELTDPTWTPVPGASPPAYSVPSMVAHRFYRVRCP